MKKVYLIALGGIFLASAVNAQNAKESVTSERAKQKTAQEYVEKAPSNISSLKSGGSQDIIYSTEFADGLPDDWSVETPEGSPCSWEWTDEGHQGAFPTQAINSSSAGNGWMILDSDFCGEEGGGQLEESYLISPVLDLSEESNVVFQFQQMFREFRNDVCRVEFSTDGGDTWPTSIEINNGTITTSNPGIVDYNVSDWIGGESEARVRFYWQGNWDYGWQIDDVVLATAYESDLKIVSSQYTDQEVLFNDDEASFQDFINGFEYTIFDETQVRNTNFTAELKSLGTMGSTGVIVTANVSYPDGSTSSFSSDPVSIENTNDSILVSLTDTYIYDDPPQTGEYSVSIEVTQDETDGNPANNIAPEETWEVAEDMFAHDAGVYETSYDLTQDQIFGVPMGLTAEMTVSHIGFVLANTNQAPSTPGQLIFVNIRQDVVFDEEDADGVGSPNDGDSEGIDDSELLFGPEELVYEIQESDLTTSTGEAVWIWYELPEPVTLEAGYVYQPELHLPPSGGDVASIAHSRGHIAYSGANFDYSGLSGGPQGWWQLSSNCPLIRFQTDAEVGLNDVDEITGVSLGQNYPNPAQELTTINYTVEKPMDLMLQVFDVNGKIVFAKDLGTASKGEHRVDLNTGRYSTGRYSYSLVNANGERLTRSMVVTR